MTPTKKTDNEPHEQNETNDGILEPTAQGLKHRGLNLNPKPDGDDSELTEGEKIKHKKEWHKFWSTQPIVSDHSTIDENEKGGPILTDVKVNEQPVGLPPGFQWVDVDLADEAQRAELFKLLKVHYVEDDDGKFRFLYTEKFLHWVLEVPGRHLEWSLGLRSTQTGGLLAYVSATPMPMKIHGEDVECIEINLLCVNKKLRKKRLAPVMILEVTRRVNLKGIFHAVYTAGDENIPGAYAHCQYHHRALNLRKLVDVGFTSKPQAYSWERYERLHRPPKYPPGEIKGEFEWRRATEDDTDAVQIILNNRFLRRDCGSTYPGTYLDRNGKYYEDVQLETTHLAQQDAPNSYVKKFDDWGFVPVGPARYYPRLSKEVIRHFITGADPEIMVCYVRVNKTTGELVDVVSFYTLLTQVLNNSNHKQLNVAYIYYCGGMLSRAEHLIACTYFGNVTGHDCMNTLLVGDTNRDILLRTRYSPGDGTLGYFAYNWRGPKLGTADIQLVLP